MVKSFEKQFRLPAGLGLRSSGSLGNLSAGGTGVQANQSGLPGQGNLCVSRISGAFEALAGKISPLVGGVGYRDGIEGFSGEEERTEYLEVRVQLRDWIFLAGCVALTILF